MINPTTVRGWLEKAIQMACQLDTDPPMLSSWSWFAENAQKALDDSAISKDEEVARLNELGKKLFGKQQDSADSPEKLRVDALSTMQEAAKHEGEGVWKMLVMSLLSSEWPDGYVTEKQEALGAQVFIADAVFGMFDYAIDGQ